MVQPFGSEAGFLSPKFCQKFGLYPEDQLFGSFQGFWYTVLFFAKEVFV